MDQMTAVFDPAKFRDPFTTAKGEKRSAVEIVFIFFPPGRPVDKASPTTESREP